jgi:hypothetical protein
MSDYQNIKAIYDDSNIRLTMERYGYNLWALLALIGIIFIFKMIDKVYLYNAFVIFLIVSFLTIYFIYVKKQS